MQYDPASLAFYDRRRVTREQFGEFERNELQEESAAYTILNALRAERRRQLLEVGRSVCQIDIRDGERTGTGFHLGGGWVMTNQHVICEANENTSSACCAKFHFPELDLEETRSRTVLFSDIRNPSGTHPWNDSRKDLALVYVEELLTSNIPGLTNLGQRQAEDNERAYLIHYGNGTNQPRGERRQQQFSINENNALFTIRNEHGNAITVHTAHSRPGSSGAPLLVYRNGQDRFVVAGVNFAGTQGQLDSPGFALLFDRENWLQDTMPPLMTKVLMYNTDHSRQDYEDLQKTLRSGCMRVTIPQGPPNVVHENDFPEISWRPACNHVGH